MQIRHDALLLLIDDCHVFGFTEQHKYVNYATPLMRYVSMCIPKQIRLQPLPENVGTERWVSKVVRQCVPGHRTGDGERPTAERAATIL